MDRICFRRGKYNSSNKAFAKVKILLISHMYPSRDNSVSGSFVHDQAYAIKNQGVEIQVIAPTPFCPPPLGLSPKWRRHRMIPKEDAIDGVSVHYARYLSFPKNRLLGFSGLSLFASLLRPRFRKLVVDAAIIHAHTVFPDGLAAARLRQKFPGKRLVLTIHGADVQRKARESTKARNMLRTCLAQVDLVLVGSEKIRALCLELGQADSEKVRVIPNGLPESTIQEGQKSLPYPQRENKVISVCNLVPDKALDVAIKAFAGLNSDWSYEIIGGGPLRKELEGLAKTVGKGNITFSGQRGKDYVLEALGRAKVYLMPSREEAFGVAYLEAMACGVPIIGTLGQGAGYIIEDGQQGFLVAVDDVESTAGALKTLMDNSDVAQRMGREGQELVATKFRLANLADRIIECYSKSTDGPS